MLDNTWATPLLFPALAHGVDVAMMGLTKYVGGHSDVMMGSLTATRAVRSEEHTSELQSLMRISYAVFCLKKKSTKTILNETSTLHATNYKNIDKLQTIID